MRTTADARNPRRHANRTDAEPGGEIMRLMYWYAVAPIVIVFGGLVFLTIPYLAIAVLAIAAFLALKKLVWAIVAALSALTGAVRRRSEVRPARRPTAVLSPAAHQHPVARRSAA
jgi:CBS domain containing-hemolysin-like protein